MKAVALTAALVVFCLLLTGAVFAADQASPAPEKVTVAQAPAKPAPAGPSTAERVESLEKQNLVLSEDLGKAQLKARQLEDVAKQQAEAIKKLNDQVAEQQAKAEAERKKQAQRNQYFWIAIGVLALGVAAN